jgi:hypothetical protein
MRALLDTLQGAGLAGAAGLRPFLPTLVAGALASADAGLDFEGTEFSFLEEPWFLLLIAALFVVVVLAEVFGRGEALSSGPGEAALAGLGVGLGALLFAGSLDDRFGTWWPGLVGGVVVALLTGAAARQLLARTRGRLDTAAARALPVYAEGAAVVLAGAAIALPPLGFAGAVFLAYLYVQGRRREGEKYAGLRILR